MLRSFILKWSCLLLGLFLFLVLNVDAQMLNISIDDVEIEKCVRLVAECSYLNNFNVHYCCFIDQQVSECFEEVEKVKAKPTPYHKFFIRARSIETGEKFKVKCVRNNNYWKERENEDNRGLYL